MLSIIKGCNYNCIVAKMNNKFELKILGNMHLFETAKVIIDLK